jgi:hypothetical protein
MRAEQCRSRERVARLARILSHAASVGSVDGADAIEDMMAVATRLSDLEVMVLSDSSREYQIEAMAHPRGGTKGGGRPSVASSSRQNHAVDLR